MVKLKYSIGKSRKFCKRWSIPTGKIGPDSLRTFYGHTELHTKLLKQCNLAYDQADKERKLQLQELEELRLEAYENSWIYKQKEGVSSRPESKLRSRWDGPFVITNVFPYGVVELKDENTNNTFQVNRHHLKEFHELPTPTVGEVESILLVEPAIRLTRITSLWTRTQMDAIVSDWTQSWTEMQSIDTGSEFMDSDFHNDHHGRMVMVHQHWLEC
ncbi:hypothetical protein CR513_23450, partial [Mucuna pruriens]